MKNKKIMQTLVESILIFAGFCAAPFFGLMLVKFVYDFNPDASFAFLIAFCMILGIVLSIIHYQENA